MLKQKSQENKTHLKFIYCFITIMMAIVIAVVFYYAICFGKNGRELEFIKQLITIIGLILAMILFAVTSLSSQEITRLEKIFATVSLLFFIEIGLSGILDILVGNIKYISFLYVIQTLIYIISNIVHLFIWFYQCNSFDKDKLYKYLSHIIYAIVATYAILLILNPFTKILFYIDKTGYVIYPNYEVDLILLICFYLSFLIYIIPQKYPIKKKLAVCSFVLFPLLYLIVAIVWDSLNINITNNSIGYIFLLLALYVVFFFDYKDSKEELMQQKINIAEKEREQVEMKTALMLSQMSPHFLYNSLTAIRNLCKNDPIEAYNSLGNFADYLRLNVDVLENGRMISFEKELEHIKTYLYLEQIRFKDELEIEYDIQFSDFSIPALTIQPIVENAVKHGATMNENGGKVLISSIQTNEGALVCIEDNGPGFDPDSINNDGVNHFGLLNVRRCLEIKNCGYMTIDSKPNIGTKVSIFIKGVNQ